MIDKINRNIQVRKAVGLAIDILKDDGYTDEELVRAVLAWSGHKCPEANPLSTMTDVEAKSFASRMMPFGKYAFAKIGEVPRDYLEWLADENLQFQRYLRATND